MSIFCEQCGNMIHINRNKNAKYCSSKCAHQHYRQNYLETTDARADLPSATVGAMHELLVCADLMDRGYHVFRAMSPSCPCDIIAMRDDTILRVEVTTGSKSRITGTITYPKHSSDRYKHDVIAVVFHGGEIMYFPEEFTP